MYKKIMLLSLLLCLCGCSSNKLSIYLESDSSLGYSWESKIDDESIIKNEDIRYAKKDGDLDGVYLFTYKPLKEGKTSIKYTYVKDDDVMYEIIYNISVSKNKQISVSSKTGTYFLETIPEGIIGE